MVRRPFVFPGTVVLIADPAQDIPAYGRVVYQRHRRAIANPYSVSC